MSGNTIITASAADIVYWEELHKHASLINDDCSAYCLNAQQGQALIELVDGAHPSLVQWDDQSRAGFRQMTTELKSMQNGTEEIAAQVRGSLSALVTRRDQPQARQQFSSIKSHLSTLNSKEAGLTEEEVGRLTSWCETMNPDVTIWGDGSWADSKRLETMLKGLMEGK